MLLAAKGGQQVAQMFIRCQQFQHLIIPCDLLLFCKGLFQGIPLLRGQPLSADFLNNRLLQNNMGVHGLFDPLRVDHSDHSPPLRIHHYAALFDQPGQCISYKGTAYAMSGGRDVSCQGLEFFEGKIGGKDVVLARSGMGKVCAAVGVLELIKNFAPA